MTLPSGFASAIDQFNAASRAYRDALAAFGQASQSEYETSLKAACGDTLRAAELLIKAHLHEVAPASIRRQLVSMKFKELVDVMQQSGRPQLNSSVAHRLVTFRQDLRNAVEHKGFVPASSEVRSALVVVREVFALYSPADAVLEVVAGSLESPAAAGSELEEYLESIRQQFRYVDLAGISPRVGGRTVRVALEDVFVPLDFEASVRNGAPPAHGPVPGGGPGLCATLNPSQEEWSAGPESPPTTIHAEAAPPRRLGTEEVLSSARVVLLGQPGTGKTTLARRIALQVASRTQEGVPEQLKGRVPLVLRATDYADAMRSSPDVSLRAHIANPQRSRFAPLIESAIKRDALFLALDGLDEIADVALRAKCARRIEEFSVEHPAIPIIVTSRPVGYQRAQIGGDFHHFEVADLTTGQGRMFLDQWHRAVHGASDEGASEDATGSSWGDDLWAKIESTPGVATLAKNPLLLTIIAMVSFHGSRLPNRRADLYAIACQTLLDNWPSRQRGASLDAGEFLHILEPVAFAMRTSSRPDVIAEAALRPILEGAVRETRGCSPEQARRDASAVLETVQELTGFFLVRDYDEAGQPLYGFLHLTFVEYLAALHLANLWDAGEVDLKQYLHSPRWHEVLLLMAGHVVAALPTAGGRLLSAIERAGSEFEAHLHRDLFLCAEILGDGARVQRERLDAIANRLIGLALTSPHLDLAVRAARALRTIASQHAVGQMLNRLVVEVADAPEQTARKTALRLFIGASDENTLAQLFEAVLDGGGYAGLPVMAMNTHFDSCRGEPVCVMLATKATLGPVGELGSQLHLTLMPAEVVQDMERRGHRLMKPDVWLSQRWSAPSEKQIFVWTQAELIDLGSDQWARLMVHLSSSERQLLGTILSIPGRLPGLVKDVIRYGLATSDADTTLAAIETVREMHHLAVVQDSDEVMEDPFEGCLDDALALVAKVDDWRQALWLWELIDDYIEQAAPEDRIAPSCFDDVDHVAFGARLLRCVTDAAWPTECVQLARRGLTSHRAFVRIAAALALGLSFEYADDEADVILRTQREVPDAAEPVNEVIEAGERVVLLMMLAKTTSATRRGALLDELKERLLAQTATTVRVKLEPRWDPDGSPLKLDGVGELIESVLANQSPASRMSAAGLWPVARLGMRHPMCIVELLDDENAGVQVAALNALRSASGLPAEVLDRVVHLLVAGDRDVRLAAKYVLREVNEPEMREWLARLVASILEQDPTSSAARGLLRDLVERA